MALIKNVAGNSQTAPRSAAVNAKKTKSYVDAVCVAAEDMGVIDTKFGKRPMIKFTFEIDRLNEYGEKRRLTRLFHKHTHPKSAWSLAAKSWLDRDLAAEEENLGEVDLKTFVDEPACLKVEPGAEYNGRRYDNITEILGRDDEDVVEEIDDGSRDAGDGVGETCEPTEPEENR